MTSRLANLVRSYSLKKRHPVSISQNRSGIDLADPKETDIFHLN